MSYGTLVRDEIGNTFAVVPDYVDPKTDGYGRRLELVRCSTRHGYRMYVVHDVLEDSSDAFLIPTALQPAATESICVVGGKKSLAFAHWFVSESDTWTIRFAQLADPRLNGLPVTSRKGGSFVGVYMTRSWFNEPAACIASDLFCGPDENVCKNVRASDVTIERDTTNLQTPTRVLPPRGLVIGDFVFCETPDKRARRVATQTPRLIVRHDDPVFLTSTFAHALRSSTHTWCDGTTLIGESLGVFCEFTPPEDPPLPFLPPQEGEEEEDAPWI